MEEIKYTIYKLIDPITNDIRYIGLTFNSLKQRLSSHMSEPGTSHKCNWISKLKKEGLKPIIESLEENISSYEEVCEREIYYINYYKSIGCNLTNMATGGNKNKKMSDETRIKMSNSAKNRNFKLVLNDDIKKHLSIKAKERFRDEGERERLRISNKKYEDSKSEEQKLNDILVQKTSKSVYKYDKFMNFIDKYPSINNAAKNNNVDSVNISKCCKHKVRMVGGFVWRFEGDLTPPEYKKGHISVLQYDMSMNFIKEYKNSNVASNETNVNSSGILSCCKGNQKSAGGFIWRYKSNIDI
jgi:group I intron endonuclease